MQSPSRRSRNNVGQYLLPVPAAAEKDLPQFLLPSCDNWTAGFCQTGLEVRLGDIADWHHANVHEMFVLNLPKRSFENALITHKLYLSRCQRHNKSRRFIFHLTTEALQILPLWLFGAFTGNIWNLKCCTCWPKYLAQSVCVTWPEAMCTGISDTASAKNMFHHFTVIVHC